MTEHPGRIFVEISTSSPMLSKSGNPPFTITLTASVEGSKTVTIDAFRTLLSPHAAALDYQGLTFTDTASGKQAPRRVIDVQYQVSEILTAASTSVVEIPSRNDSRSYTVQHTFQLPPPERPVSQPTVPSENAGLEALGNDLIRELSDQTVGLEVGQTYEIGLGDSMNQVSWWRLGNRSEVFARGSVSRRAEGAKLQLELTKTATFTVVE